MEKAAIELIQKTANIEAVIDHSKTATSKNPTVVLPDGYSPVDLEQHMEFRSSYRGQFDTVSTPDFINYVCNFATAGSTCFIDNDSFSATTIFDMGSVAQPEHMRHRAKLQMRKTVAYRALLAINNNKLMQKDLSEWLEDWKDVISVIGIDGNPMTAMQAVSAVRKITIESSRKMESEIGDFNSNMSALEKIEATSSMMMPAYIQFSCRPYNDLSERGFTLRMGILTGGDKPVLVLRVMQLESIQEEIVEEFKELIVDLLESRKCKIDTYIGDF